MATIAAPSCLKQLGCLHHGDPSRAAFGQLLLQQLQLLSHLLNLTGLQVVEFGQTLVETSVPPGQGGEQQRHLAEILCNTLQVFETLM